jgi:hypothetical protein
MVFARRHDGAVQYTKSTDGGANWSTPGALPSVVGPDVKSYTGLEVALKGPGAFPTDLINSGLAACISAIGDRCYLFGRKPDSRIYFRRSTDAGATWESWQPIPNGLFHTGPAAAASADGKIVHVCGVGLDQKLYWSRSVDGGKTWSAWALVGQDGAEGPFTSTSAPALAMSADGQMVYTFARRDDRSIWYNQSWYHQSPHGGIDRSEWFVLADWELSDQGKVVNVATSSPAAVASSDGTGVIVVVRGSDRGMWYYGMGSLATATETSSVAATWQKIPYGTFTSAPAIAMNHEGVGSVSVVALADDFTLYATRGHFTPGGDYTWDGWSPLKGLKVGDFFA